MQDLERVKHAVPVYMETEYLSQHDGVKANYTFMSDQQTCEDGTLFYIDGGWIINFDHMLDDDRVTTSIKYCDGRVVWICGIDLCNESDSSVEPSM